MTYYSLMETISISVFKARISEQLRKVRSGETLLIADRNHPVARVVPVENESKLRIRSAKRKPAIPPPPDAVEHDPLLFLFEERQGR